MLIFFTFAINIFRHVVHILYISRAFACLVLMYHMISAVDCGPLSVPMNGSSAGDSTVFPNSVHFNCDSGFILNGSIRRTCQANGTWSGVPTVCNGRFKVIIETNLSSRFSIRVAVHFVSDYFKKGLCFI